MTQLTLQKENHVVHPSALRAILITEKEKKSAPITIQSRQTSKDYTFKISRSEYYGLWYTHVWLEVRSRNYKHLGTWNSGYIVKGNKKVVTKAARSIAWVLRRVWLKEYDKLQRQVLVMHSGRCMACGRELTDASSIKRGIGPVCAEVLK